MGDNIMTNKRLMKYIGIANASLKLDLDRHIIHSCYYWISNNYEYPIDARILAQGLMNAYIICDEDASMDVCKFIADNI